MKPPVSASFAADDDAKDATAFEAPATETADGPVAAERMVIRNARVTLRSDAPNEVAIVATRLAEQVGGFVESSDTQGVGEEISRVDAAIRVPADRFESVLTELRAHGELLQETVTGDDVTDQHADLGARLRSQRVLEERLLTILGKVESVEDALTVEAQLVGVRTQIERLEGSMRNMEKRAAMATITLVVEAPVRHNVASAETVLSRLDRAVDDAGRMFIGGIAALIRLLGAVLPVLLAMLPLMFVGRRVWRNRRRERALIAAARVGSPASGHAHTSSPIPPA